MADVGLEDALRVEGGVMAGAAQDHLNRLANKLLRRAVAGYEYRVVRQLEGYLDAPGFAGMNHKDMINKAFEIHALPSPYDYESWIDPPA